MVNTDELTNTTESGLVFFKPNQITTRNKKKGQTGLSAIHKMHKKHDKLVCWDEWPILYIHKYSDTQIKM